MQTSWRAILAATAVLLAVPVLAEPRADDDWDDDDDDNDVQYRSTWREQGSWRSPGASWSDRTYYTSTSEGYSSAGTFSRAGFQFTSPRTVSGRLVEIIPVNVQGETCLLASIDSPSAGFVKVYLGSANQIDRLNLRAGDRITLNSDQAVLVAGSLEANGQFVRVNHMGDSARFATSYDTDNRRFQTTGTIDRNPGRYQTRVEGQIDSLHIIAVDGQRHLIAYLRGADNWTQRIDLGPVENSRRYALREGDWITADGYQTNLYGEMILQATSVEPYNSGYTGRATSYSDTTSGSRYARNVNEPAVSTRFDARGTQTYRGEILRVGTLDMPTGDDHFVAHVRMNNGRVFELDLGEKGTVDDDVEVGKYLMFTAPAAAFTSGDVRILADQYMAEGENEWKEAYR